MDSGVSICINLVRFVKKDCGNQRIKGHFESKHTKYCLLQTKNDDIM